MVKSSDSSSNVLIAAGENQGNQSGKVKCQSVAAVSAASQQSRRKSRLPFVVCVVFVLSNWEVTESQKEDCRLCLFLVIEAKSSLKHFPATQ